MAAGATGRADAVEDCEDLVPPSLLMLPPGTKPEASLKGEKQTPKMLVVTLIRQVGTLVFLYFSTKPSLRISDFSDLHNWIQFENLGECFAMSIRSLGSASIQQKAERSQSGITNTCLFVTNRALQLVDPVRRANYMYV